MPPKRKFDKESILNIATEMIAAGEELTARSVAKKAGCSTQPLFSCFADMEELKRETYSRALRIYNDYIYKARDNVPPYKATGVGYIEFAREKPNLFKLLFMSSSKEGADEIDFNEIIPIVQKATGYDYETAKDFHFYSWIFVHGIASMIASGFINWDRNTVDKALTTQYLALREKFDKKEATRDE